MIAIIVHLVSMCEKIDWYGFVWGRVVMWNTLYSIALFQIDVLIVFHAFMTVGMMIVCHETFALVLFAHECVQILILILLMFEIVITDCDNDTKLLHWICLWYIWMVLEKNVFSSKCEFRECIIVKIVQKYHWDRK